MAPVNASRGHFFVNNQEAGEKTVNAKIVKAFV
jgi:hypothetical protein